jgi:hypothetical protein
MIYDENDTDIYRLGDITCRLYISDSWIGTLSLHTDGGLSYEWSTEWFTSSLVNPFSGIPGDTHGRIAGPRIDWIFDNFYLPRSPGNLRRSLRAVGLDENDHSDHNRRLLLFIVPYREYGISFGAPGSHFDGCVSSTLKLGFVHGVTP